MTESPIKLESVSYYPLPKTNKVDVFLRKDFDTYVNDEGETVHTCKEKLIQVYAEVTKQEIEENFERYWNPLKIADVSLEERVEDVENVINMLLGLGGEYDV